jgi:hypothetical protein
MDAPALTGKCSARHVESVLTPRCIAPNGTGITGVNGNGTCITPFILCVRLAKTLAEFSFNMPMLQQDRPMDPPALLVPADFPGPPYISSNLGMRPQTLSVAQSASGASLPLSSMQPMAPNPFYQGEVLCTSCPVDRTHNQFLDYMYGNGFQIFGQFNPQPFVAAAPYPGKLLFVSCPCERRSVIIHR